MKIAVTSHAVDRYTERVEGAKGFRKESIRSEIRHIVDDGFAHGLVREHPLDPERRIIPFRSGSSVLFLSIGPNTTDYDADLAVIGVLYEKELTVGKVGLSLRLGDVFPELKEVAPQDRRPKYILFIGPVETTVERYYAADEMELRKLVNTRAPKPDETTIYSRIE